MVEGSGISSTPTPQGDTACSQLWQEVTTVEAPSVRAAQEPRSEVVDPVARFGQGMDISIPEVVAFGGIPDPASDGRRSSRRIQGQPDADEFQLGRAMRLAKIRDTKSSTGPSLNTSCSVLHFSENDIMHKADNLGISLGNNNREVVTSINELLDLETDRAMVMLKNIAAIKPMKES